MRCKMSKIKEMTNDKLFFFNVTNVICMKNNQTSVKDADREIPTLGSMDTGNTVNFVSDIIRSPSGWVGISRSAWEIHYTIFRINRYRFS